jgi:CRISPR system Cascade subunit CasE
MYFSRIQLRPEVYRNTQLAKVIANNSYDMHRLFWDLFAEDRKRSFLFREEIAREQLGVRSGARGEPVYYVVSATRPKTDNPLFQVNEKPYQPQLSEGDILKFELRANPVVTHSVDRENPEQYLRERSKRNVVDKSKLTKRRVRHDIVMHEQRVFLQDLCSELNLSLQPHEDQKKGELKQFLLSQGGQKLDVMLTVLLEGDERYADRLQQSLSLNDKLEWAIKAMVDKALEKWMVLQGERNGFLICRDKYGQSKLQSSGYLWHSLGEKDKKAKKPGFSSVDFTGELEVTDVVKFMDALFNGIGPAKAFGCGLLMVRRA